MKEAREETIEATYKTYEGEQKLLDWKKAQLKSFEASLDLNQKKADEKKGKTGLTCVSCVELVAKDKENIANAKSDLAKAEAAVTAAKKAYEAAGVAF